jgi:hypothetical protein
LLTATAIENQRCGSSPGSSTRPPIVATILDRQLFDGGFVQQHILHANGHNGGSIVMRVCIVIKLGANGLISRIDEYFDPAEIAPLLESADSQRR